MLEYTLEEEQYQKGYRSICGVDEAGRGPLCGPVVAAAVILPVGLYLEGLNDSKKLTEKKREILFDQICQSAIAYAIAEGSVERINETNILEATLFAMKEAGTVWVPTLSTVGNLRGKGRFCETAVEKILENAMENVAAFAQIGGLLAPGTDAGAWQVPHSIDSEYRLLEEALGASAEKVLSRGIAAIQGKF